VTFDNDTAFAQHGFLSSMRDMTTWFYDAYASWQKGGVENANRRLRRLLPRDIDVFGLSDEDIQEIALIVKLTLRKCLGFKSPFQALHTELGKDVENPLRLNRCASPQKLRKKLITPHCRSRMDWSNSSFAHKRNNPSTRIASKARHMHACHRRLAHFPS
jgi:hypothetical protein